ncbi:MAG: cyclophilin-like fold protein [Methanomethylophilus sp.]|jgi:hypothetical protein
MKMKITDREGITVVIALNGSSASRDLVRQAPKEVKLENYSDDEKIFYPGRKLDVSDTPAAHAAIGTLGYFEPWGDVCLYYGDFGSYPGLYELGKTVSGEENIRRLAPGRAEIEFLGD